MGQPTFLVFYGPDTGRTLTEDMVLEDLVEHLLLLQLEDAGHQIGAVHRYLPRQRFPMGLGPIRIGRHRDKQVWFLEPTGDGHESRTHGPFAADM